MDGFSLNLSWKRLLVLGGLLSLYFALGGFTPPETRLMIRPWGYMLVLFCAGAISATVIDHEYGMFPPSNLRPLYIVLGAILMAAALVWMYSLRNHLKATQEALLPKRLPSVLAVGKIQGQPPTLGTIKQEVRSDPAFSDA